MVALRKYQNKNIAIYGMGITGCSAAKTLKKLKAKIFCWDDNQKTRKKIDFPISKFWLKKYQIDNIVISPGIDIEKCKIKNYLKKNVHKIITDLDLFFELNKSATVISITGTNGKSTTCKIIEKILKTANYRVKTVGNIGNPILSLNKIKKKYFLILEVSSYQLQYSRLFRSSHAAILNISPDHLERHKNIKNYTKIKSRIFFAQKKLDYSYVNFENKNSKMLKSIFRREKLKSKLVLVKKSSCSTLLKKIKNKYFKSSGNIENLAFACKIVKNLKINDKVIIRAINKFKGLPHRQEIISSGKNFTCVNDSKATSFDACQQSLNSYNNIYWILGGIPKHRDSFNLSKVSKKVIKAFIIGKHTSFFTQKLKNKIPYTLSYTLKNAVKNLCNELKNKKNLHNTVLFSPAAASFDQFRNFEDRGKQFKNLIKGKSKIFFYV